MQKERRKKKCRSRNVEGIRRNKEEKEERRKNEGGSAPQLVELFQYTMNNFFLLFQSLKDSSRRSPPRPELVNELDSVS